MGYIIEIPVFYTAYVRSSLRIATFIYCFYTYPPLFSYFSIKDNGIKCTACARQDKGAIKISKIAYTAILYILSSEPKKIFSFEIPEDAINELALFLYK